MTANDPATGLLARTKAKLRDLIVNPRLWVNPKRKRSWVLAAVLFYTLAGFLLVPWVAKNQIVTRLGEALERPVALESLRVNPWTLTVDARGFAISEADGGPLLGFDRLFVNLQVRSLFRWAWTFREIRLEAPRLELIRQQDGTLNLSDLAPGDAPDVPDAPAEGDTPGSLPRLIVDSLELVDGNARFTDRTRPTLFETHIGPVALSLHDVSTLPDREGRQRVAVLTGNGARIAWEGSLRLDPFSSSGQLTGGGPHVPLLYTYFQDDLGFRVREGEASFELDYTISLPADGEPEVSVQNFAFTLRGIEVEQENAEILSLSELSILGGHLDLRQRTAGIESLVVSSPKMLLWRDPEGTLSAIRWWTGTSGEGNGTEPAADGDPSDSWSLGLEALEIVDLDLVFEDRALQEPARIEVPEADLKVTGLSNTENTQFPLYLSLSLPSDGTVELSGELSLLPTPELTAELGVANAPLVMLQPYLAEVIHAAIESGALSLNATLTVNEDEPFAANGELAVSNLSLAARGADSQLAGWRRLEVDAFALSLQDTQLNLSSVALQEPYGRFAIAEDGSSNIQRLLVSPAASPEAPAETDASASAATADAQPFRVTIGEISLEEGALDFADRSLPIPFSAKVAGLGGSLSAFDTTSAEPSSIDLQGQVEDYGLARIRGTLSTLDPTQRTDVEMLFRNVEVPDLSPYTIRFASRRIADGRMDLDLRYRLNDGQLDASNNIVLSDLELGEKVPHPDALELPLGLAIALLKGPDGRIDVDIPVSGDVNDPQFAMGRVIARAVANLITRIVTSPFRLLGSLVGAGSEELGEVEFEPGVATMTPPELEKLHRLAEALALRPELVLRVPGVTATEADREALAAARVDDRIDEEIAALRADSEQADDPLVQRRRAVEGLYREAFPEDDLQALRETHVTVAAEDAAEAKPTLDTTAYLADLRRRLIEAQTVTDEELDTLGRSRAEAVVAELAADERIAEARLVAAEIDRVELTDDGWIPMSLQLDVTAGSGKDPGND